MIWIVDDFGQRILENRRRFNERNPVLPKIRSILGMIPDEVHIVHAGLSPRT